MSRYLLSDAAAHIGVAPITLKRWLLAGKVHEVNRDRNGWRVFDEQDIERIRGYAQSLHPPVAEGVDTNRGSQSGVAQQGID